MAYWILDTVLLDVLCPIHKAPYKHDNDISLAASMQIPIPGSAFRSRHRAYRLEIHFNMAVERSICNPVMKKYAERDQPREMNLFF